MESEFCQDNHATKQSITLDTSIESGIYLVFKDRKLLLYLICFLCFSGLNIEIFAWLVFGGFFIDSFFFLFPLCFVHLCGISKIVIVSTHNSTH